MRLNKILEFFLFISGFIFGAGVYFSCFSISQQVILHHKLRQYLSPESQTQAEPQNELFNRPPVKYETELAEKLEKEIRILCWVFTHPDNHAKKVPHVRATWGHKCTKLLFMSIKEDPTQPDIIAIPVENGRAHLWNKTKLVMKYVYDNYKNEADWFMRADDDK